MWEYCILFVHRCAFNFKWFNFCAKFVFVLASSAISFYFFFFSLHGISRLVQFHIKIPIVRLEAREQKKNIESNLITLEKFKESQCWCSDRGSCDNGIFTYNVGSQFSITNAIPSIVSMAVDVCRKGTGRGEGNANILIPMNGNHSR